MNKQMIRILGGRRVGAGVLDKQRAKLCSAPSGLYFLTRQQSVGFSDYLSRTQVRAGGRGECGRGKLLPGTLFTFCCGHYPLKCRATTTALCHGQGTSVPFGSKGHFAA